MATDEDRARRAECRRGQAWLSRPLSRPLPCAEELRDSPRFLAYLTVQAVAQDGGLAVDLFARAHDIAKRAVLRCAPPGRDRRGALQREVVVPPDVLLRQAQRGDGHKRGERLRPQLRRLLDGHLGQIDAELDLNGERV